MCKLYRCLNTLKNVEWLDDLDTGNYEFNYLHRLKRVINCESGN